jgi:hypothetical protein
MRIIPIYLFKYPYIVFTTSMATNLYKFTELDGIHTFFGNRIVFYNVLNIKVLFALFTVYILI